jgi:hypothetical protein
MGKEKELGAKRGSNLGLDLPLTDTVSWGQCAAPLGFFLLHTSREY